MCMVLQYLPVDFLLFTRKIVAIIQGGIGHYFDQVIKIFISMRSGGHHHIRCPGRT
jgi:hypothetical protein